MAKRAISVVLPEGVGADDFLEVVGTLEGTRQPGDYMVGQIFRGESRVWIYASEEPTEPEETYAREGKLGGPVGSELVMEFSIERNTEILVVELLEAAAQRWSIVVDTLLPSETAGETLLTMEIIRERAALTPDHIFSGPLPPADTPERASWYERMGLKEHDSDR